MAAFASMSEFWDYTRRFTDYELRTDHRVDRRTFDLDRMHRLLDAIGRPDDAYPILQVAGTNGKGTVAHLALRILGQAGLRVGLFTSPHLVGVRERIRVGGVPLEEGQWLESLGRLAPHLEIDTPEGRPTFFEILTAMALDTFARREVDVAILEVGLGGRLDATSAARPAAVAITEIDLDHTAQLGSTVEEIAAEKAAILRPGVPAVCSVGAEAAREVVRRTGEEVGAPMAWVGDDLVVDIEAPVIEEGTRFDLRSWVRGYSNLFLPIPGYHFLPGVALALGLCEVLKAEGLIDFSSADLRPALASAVLPGRCQRVEASPAVLLDGAHNPASARALVATLSTHFPDREPVLLLGVAEDKDIDGVVGAFGRANPALRRAYVTRIESPRSMAPDALGERVRSIAGVSVEAGPDAVALFDRARAGLDEDEILVVAGSLYLAGEILRKRYPEGVEHGAAD